MATDNRDGVKTQEPSVEARLAATPQDTPKPGQAGQEGVLRLGKRTYPVWTPAMVEAREKLRKAGRKWYLLSDKLHAPRNLEGGWKQVERNQGAPGVSGETIEEYGKTIGERLARLGRGLREQTWQPRPIRQKEIPKADGSGKKRPLGIPEVEDRIVQAALVAVIEPIFEGKFLGSSHGFRPGHSALEALSVVEQAISTDRPWLVDADIRNCFGSIPHEPLLNEVAKEISDIKILKLIRSFVKADIVAELRTWTPEKGTPQGAVLSPLLANIYLHEFDRQMAEAGYEVVRYADDFVVLCRNEEECRAAKAKAEVVLQGMGLEMHPEKSRVVNTRQERFQFLGYEFWPSGRQPRKSSLHKLRDGIRAKTPRSSGRSLRETIRILNRTLRGWYGYFRHSFWNVLTGVDGFVRRRLRSILRKFAKQRGTSKGNGNDHVRYPNHLFERMGLFSMDAQRVLEAGRTRRAIPFPAKA